MSIVTWGNLPKSQIDNETIEEAITRLIAAHNDDADAHLETGQSLQSHKASEIIDHLALSIIQDKIGDGEISLQKLIADHHIIVSALESLDGWFYGGTIKNDLSCVWLKTTNSSDNVAYLGCTPTFWYPLNWDKDFFWQTSIEFSDNTEQVIYFGIGGSDKLGDCVFVGFKISNGTLYCCFGVDEGGGYSYTSQEISGITITDPNVYRIIYIQSEGTLNFYVNGVLKKTWDSGLPTESSNSLAYFEMKTTSDNYRSFYLYDFLFSSPK